MYTPFFQRVLSFLLFLGLAALLSSQGNGCQKRNESCYECQAFGNAPGSDISTRICGSESERESWIAGVTAEGYQDAYCIQE